jgi:hypothetical protein
MRLDNVFAASLDGFSPANPDITAASHEFGPKRIAGALGDACSPSSGTPGSRNRR